MKRATRILRRYWFSILVLAVLAYVLATRVDFHQFARTFVEVDAFYVLLAILANFASILLKTASWKVIFDYSFTGIHARWRDLFSALMIGFLVNALMPVRLGEIARTLVIGRRQGIVGEPVSRSTVFGTVVLERVFDGVVMGVFVLYGVLNMDLPDWAVRGAVVLVAAALAFAAVLAALALVKGRLEENPPGAESERPGWRRRLATRFHGILVRFSEGQRLLGSPGRIALVSLTTGLSWLSQLLAVYFSLGAFHLEGVGMMGALLLLILINVAGALPATPANVGIFQLATVVPLAVTYGIPEATALAFSIGLQVIEGSIGVGGGSICLLREGLTLEEISEGSRREAGRLTGGGDDDASAHPTGASLGDRAGGKD